MLYGWKVFQGVVLVLCALGGAVGGGYLGHMRGHAAAGAIGGAVVAVLIAGPLLRYVIGLIGGAAGAIAGLYLWHRFHLEPEYIWVGAVAGFLVCGALAFLVLRFSVIVLSSVQGAVCALIGIAALALSQPHVAEHARRVFIEHPWALPATGAACALFSVCFQYSRRRAETAAAAN